MIDPIPLGGLSQTAKGVSRPEDVVVTPDGRVLVSDAQSAVAEILADGNIRRFGAAGGEPNGIDLAPDGSVLIANFSTGTLQRLDLVSERVQTVIDRVGDRALTSVNYPLVDSSGAVWVSCSTQTDPALAIATGVADGYIFRLDPDGTATLVAEGIAFPNCMTFDDSERYLYVVRSTMSDVARFEVLPDKNLGPAQRYGPVLGDRRADEFGEEMLSAFGQPDVLARWGITDGCAFDADGNLWVTVMSANRIVAITPELDPLVVVDDPEGSIMVSPTSVAFGGPDRRDLYVGSLISDYVVTGRSPVAGRLSRGYPD
jgi:sugar lactone lactonase YvrE